MDRYGASARDSESDHVYIYDHPRRDGGQRSGRHDHRSSFQDDEDSNLGRHTHRAARRGAVSHTLHASTNESDHNPHYRGSGSDENRPPRHHRRDRSPITLTFDYNDPEEFGHGNLSVGGYATRRPDPRDCADDDDDDDDISPRTRGGRSGPGIGRAPGLHGRSDLSFTSNYTEGDGESHSGSRREGCGLRGRDSMAHGGSVDDESGDGEYASRWGGRRDVRGGVRARRCGRGGSEEDGSGGSEDGGLRGRGRGARGYGGGSAR